MSFLEITRGDWMFTALLRTLILAGWRILWTNTQDSFVNIPIQYIQKEISFIFLGRFHYERRIWIWKLQLKYGMYSNDTFKFHPQNASAKKMLGMVSFKWRVLLLQSFNNRLFYVTLTCTKHFGYTYSLLHSKVVKYCSRKCQHKHWPNHKKDCKLLAAMINDEEGLSNICREKLCYDVD